MASVSTSERDDQWACPKCTLLNQPKHRRCRACGGRKQVETVVVAAAASNGTADVTPRKRLARKRKRPEATRCDADMTFAPKPPSPSTPPRSTGKRQGRTSASPKNHKKRTAQHDSAPNEDSAKQQTGKESDTINSHETTPEHPVPLITTLKSRPSTEESSSRPDDISETTAPYDSIDSPHNAVEENTHDHLDARDAVANVSTNFPKNDKAATTTTDHSTESMTCPIDGEMSCDLNQSLDALGHASHLPPASFAIRQAAGDFLAAQGNDTSCQPPNDRYNTQPDETVADEDDPYPPDVAAPPNGRMDPVENIPPAKERNDMIVAEEPPERTERTGMEHSSALESNEQQRLDAVKDATNTVAEDFAATPALLQNGRHQKNHDSAYTNLSQASSCSSPRVSFLYTPPDTQSSLDDLPLTQPYTGAAAQSTSEQRTFSNERATNTDQQADKVAIDLDKRGYFQSESLNPTWSEHTPLQLENVHQEEQPSALGQTTFAILSRERNACNESNGKGGTEKAESSSTTSNDNGNRDAQPSGVQSWFPAAAATNDHDHVGTPNRVVVFQTAGSNSRIHVSEDAVLIADRLLKDESSNNVKEQPTPVDRYIDSESSATNRLTKSSNNKNEQRKIVTVRAMPMSQQSNAKAAAMFQTAGKGISISVSKESMARANSLFDDSVSKAQGSESHGVAMFQTAGKCAAISVSKESLDRANKLFDDSAASAATNSVPANPPRPSGVAMFQTAGKGVDIAVSKECIDRANKLFDDSAASATNPSPLQSSDVAMFQTTGKRPAISTSKESIVRANSLSTDSSGVAMFQTAGKRAAIAVSKESIDRANKIFDDTADFTINPSTALQPPKSSGGALFHTAGKGAAISISKESIDRAKSLFDDTADSTIIPSTALQTPQSSGVAMFHTGGKEAAIAVSKESIERAKKLFDDRADSTINPSTFLQPPKSSGMAMFQTAGKGTSISVSMESMARANSLFDDSISKTQGLESYGVAMFQTAGKGAAISVSKESIDRANKLFDDSAASVATNLVPAKPPKPSGVALFQTAGKGADIAVSKESLARANKLFDDSAASATNPSPLQSSDVAMFQTTGKRPAISTSKESMDRANKLLDDPALSAINPSTTFKLPKPSGVAMFQTAGMGAAIAVSKECMDKASKLFDKSDYASVNPSVGTQNSLRTFQTAGEGSSVSVSKEDLERVNKLFDNLVSSNIVNRLSTEDGSVLPDYAEKENLASVQTHQIPVTPYFQRTQVPSADQEMQSFNPVGAEKDAAYTPCWKLDSADHMQSHVKAHQDTTPHASLHAIDPAISITPKEGRVAQSACVTFATGDFGWKRKQQVSHDPAMTPVPMILDVGMSMTTPEDFSDDSQAKLTASAVKAFQCYTLQDALKLGRMTQTVEECIDHGVHEATLNVSSANALSIQFDSNGFPESIEEDNQDNEASLSICSKVRQSLKEYGFSDTQIKDAWIKTHARLVIWKLASYERRFSRFLAGQHLTYNNLIAGLITRFQKEIVEGHRPVLRRILNCDASPRAAMILLVCGVVSSAQPHDNKTPNAVLELSDGWYCVKTLLDKKLTLLLKKGVIKVGTKLLVSNGHLGGVEEGVDPLDEGGSADKAMLQLAANSTRLAKWNSKLGLVRPNKSHVPKGKLLVKRISDVIPGGGNLPVIRVFVERVYPLLYYEKCEGDATYMPNTSSLRRPVLTQQEEDVRRRDFEKRRSLAIEKATEKLQSEIEKEIDEDAPSAWLQMKNGSSPEDVFESLNENDRNEVVKWQEHRSVLIQQRIQDEVQAELETETSLFRESTPFLRVKIRSLDPLEGRRESAILTIWHPNEEHLNLLKEGSSVQVSSLSVRETEFDGHLQFSANKQTVIEPFVCEWANFKNRIGFTERSFLTLIEVHELSHLVTEKGGDVETHRVDFDTAGGIVRLVESLTTRQETVFYLTDESQLLLRVHCKSVPQSMQDLLQANEFPVLALCDLRLHAFDAYQQCAVAELGDLSSVQLSNDRVEELIEWKVDTSNADLLQVCTCLDLGLPPSEQICDRKVGIGYIVGLRIESRSENIHIQVDCCGYGCQEWEVPMSIVHDMLTALSSEKHIVALSLDEDIAARRMGALGHIFRKRGALWQFQLEFNVSSTSRSQHVVSKAALADKTTLARYYLTLPEPEPPEDRKGQ